MKYLFGLLLLLHVQFAKAQNDREIIETALKTTDFVFKNNRDAVIKQYGADFENTFAATIKELSPMTNSTDFYIRGGSNVAIVLFYRCLINKEIDLGNNSSGQKIKDYLLLAKDALDKGFSIEEKLFNDTKGVSTLSYVAKNGDTYEYAKTRFMNLYDLMAYYFGSDNSVYLQAVDRLLEHLINTRIYLAKNQWNKDNRARYIDNYTDFGRAYSLVGCAYGRVNGLKTSNKIKEELKHILLDKLPAFRYENGFQYTHFENNYRFDDYFDWLLFRAKIDMANMQLNHDLCYVDYLSVLYEIDIEFTNLYAKEEPNPKRKELFIKKIKETQNLYFDFFDELNSKNTYCSCFQTPIYIYQHYNFVKLFRMIEAYGTEFKKRYINSLTGALRVMGTNNKKWYLYEYSKNYGYLKVILDALAVYYKDEKDDINLAKIKNCLKVIKEEPSLDAREIREALEAL